MGQCKSTCAVLLHSSAQIAQLLNYPVGCDLNLIMCVSDLMAASAISNAGFLRLDGRYVFLKIDLIPILCVIVLIL